MKKLLKKRILLFLPIVIILVIVSAIRYLYFTQVPGIVVSEDTYSYFVAMERMVREHILVDNFRPPVYPLMLYIIMYIQKAQAVSVFSYDIFSRLPPVILTQSLLGIISTLLIYLILKKMQIKPVYSMLFTIFIGTNIIIFSFERLILTESLGLYLLISTVYLTQKILHKPKFILFAVLYLQSILMVFNRPIYKAYPLIPLFVVAYFLKSKRVVLYCCIVLILYMLTLLSYNQANYERFGVNDVSSASSIALFGKVLSYNLNIENAKDEYFYPKIREYRILNKQMDPFRFMEHYAILNMESIDIHMKMGPYAKKVILRDFPKYAINIIREFPSSLFDVSDKMILPNNRTDFFAVFFNSLYKLNRSIQKIFILIILALPISLYQFFRKQNLFSSFMVLVCLTSTYQISAALFVGYSEYGRLILPSQPLQYISSIYALSIIFNFIKRQKIFRGFLLK